MVAWAIGAVVALLLVAPLAFVLSAPARHAVSGRNLTHATLATTGPAGQSSALGVAIPGVEAKTGLKYSDGACPSGGPCLRLAGQVSGLNAAAIEFSTSANGGRQCVGYVYQDAGTWHFLNASCGLPGQLSPMVGNDATVHVPGQCANVRDAAVLSGKIVACLNDGSAVHVDGGPNYADGKLWWHLQKNGWMAHDFLVGA
jgi:hypothetical protein